MIGRGNPSAEQERDRRAGVVSCIILSGEYITEGGTAIDIKESNDCIHILFNQFQCELHVCSQISGSSFAKKLMFCQIILDTLNTALAISSSTVLTSF